MLIAIALQVASAPIVGEQALYQAQAAWRTCALDNVMRFVRDPEPAATVVNAAFGRCSKARTRYAEALVAVQVNSVRVFSDDEVRYRIEHMRANLADRLTAFVMDLRAHRPVCEAPCNDH